MNQSVGMKRMFKGQTMTVSVDEVSAMQAGYEGRLARQVAIIERLQGMLQGRTDQLAFQMQEENRRAAEWGIEPVNEIRVIGEDDPITQLWALVPKDWDQYNEDDNQTTALAGYIKWLQEEVESRSGSRLAGKVKELQAQLAEVQRERDQAQVDARHNAKVANSKPTVVVMDDPDRPPWLDGGPKAKHTIIAPTLLERNTPTVAPRYGLDGDSETVAFDGFGGHAGETRPGKF